LDDLSEVDVLLFDLSCAELAGRIYADLESTGQPIGRSDPMIAAIALRHDLLLVTGNHAHYKRIEKLGYDLRLDNWRA
jgi:predicted nucleic acid-binding protein